MEREEGGGTVKLLIRVAEGGLIPSGFRIAYLDFERHEFVAAPNGLHWLVRLCRRALEVSYRYPPSKMEQALVDAYSAGLQDGRDSARGLDDIAATVAVRGHYELEAYNKGRGVVYDEIAAGSRN